MDVIAVIENLARSFFLAPTFWVFCYGLIVIAKDDQVSLQSKRRVYIGVTLSLSLWLIQVLTSSYTFGLLNDYIRSNSYENAYLYASIFALPWKIGAAIGFAFIISTAFVTTKNQSNS